MFCDELQTNILRSADWCGQTRSPTDTLKLYIHLILATYICNFHFKADELGTYSSIDYSKGNNWILSHFADKLNWTSNFDWNKMRF